MKINMTKEEFEEWKINWGKRIPQCNDFICCHELMSCCIKIFCNQGSIYETYIKDKNPEECNTVGCIDCMLKYECKKSQTFREK